jgi:hypothetical protein
MTKLFLVPGTPVNIERSLANAIDTEQLELGKNDVHESCSRYGVTETGNL